MKRKILALFAVLILTCLPAALAQDTSRVVPFPGGITTTLTPDTTQTFNLEIWTAAVGGTMLYTETHTLDVDSSGLVYPTAGSATANGLDPAHFPSGSSRYLDLTQAGVSVLVSGRLPLNAGFFALSPGPQGPAGPQGVQGPPGPPVSLVSPGSTIAIGGSITNRTLDVAANAIANAHVANGALSPAKIAGTAATLGPNNFTGLQSINGPLSASVSGLGTGVMGGSSSGPGVVGNGGVGVYGNSTSGGTGVYGSGDTGVSGNGRTGVRGSSPVLNGNGVVGNAHNGAFAYGVWGNSSGGTGVYGSGGTGVYGSSLVLNGNGVVGHAHNGTNAWGVWGSSSSGYAGYFAGRVHVQGTLSKSAGSFKIDHPLDPANKYLSHSFVESPDMMNLYNGVAVLDDDGEAVVPLPEWFEALNRDFRYQLTCIGGFAPVYIAEKVANNRFKIAGGTPGMEVSWQVTGIRQDAFANAHRIPVEEDKPAEERGFYLHPQLYGAPEEKGIEWAHKPELMKRMKEEAAKPSAEAKP